MCQFANVLINHSTITHYGFQFQISFEHATLLAYLHIYIFAHYSCAAKIGMVLS